MKTMYGLGVVSLAAVVLAGCAQHTWAPGPGATLPFGQASGQCKLMALNGQTSAYVTASGSPKFVAAAVGAGVAAGAIASAVRQQNIYNACMEANGFVEVDAQGQGRGAGDWQPGDISGDPTVDCHLPDSAPMEMHRSVCEGRGGTF